MLFYLVSFFLCFLLDTKTMRNKQGVYLFGCLWMFCFLCFGYMCGSDWRQYERYYTQESFDHFEIGSYLTFHLFTILGVDFWAFVGFMKILYLSSLLSLVSIFTEKKWSAIGIEFIIGSLLFMLISGPIKFMLATTVALFSIVLYLRNHKIYALLSLLLSCTFHFAFIINVLILLSYFFLEKFIIKLGPITLILCYGFIYAVIVQSTIFNIVYIYLIPFFNFEEQVEGYEQIANMANLFSLGNLKELFLFILIVIFRKDILKLKYGNILLYFALISSFLFIFLKCIPVGSRFNIVNKIFMSIAFAEMLYIKILKPNVKLLFRMVMSGCFFVTIYNIYNDVVFIPYSNSIPYIIIGHKPFSERTDYNINAYRERTGKTYDTEDRSY